MIQFFCNGCGHKLKARPALVGKPCKCTRCGRLLTVPGPPFGATPTAEEGVPPPASPRRRTGVLPLVLGYGLAAVLLAAAGLTLVVFLLLPGEVSGALGDLKSGTREVRCQALVRLAEADPTAADRGRVTAALEPLLTQGDVRHELDPDLVLRAYLHWVGSDNVSALMRMVKDPATLPAWNPTKSGLVLEALGKLRDKRAVGVLADKLADPALRDQAVAALRLMGRRAEIAVLPYSFDADPDVRLRAGQLLADYGTGPNLILGEALTRLKSNSPDDRSRAVAWFAENAPADEASKADVAPFLAGLLDDLSPRADDQVLQALRLWATKDCLPQLVAFARREDKSGGNVPALLDVLSRIPDPSAADAIGLRLEDPAHRELAAAALVKLGPAATGTVLHYVDDPDAGVRKAARHAAEQLSLPADRQLAQTLADVADVRKGRSLTALEHLARVRADEPSRPAVSRALNAPLLDPDPKIREAALDAVHVWGSSDNVPTLLKLLGSFPEGGQGCDPRILQKLSADLITIGPAAEDGVIPLLKSPPGPVWGEACRILSEVGTAKSVEPLQEAGQRFGGPYVPPTQIAIDKILARQ
jgi:hypothetical protein